MVSCKNQSIKKPNVLLIIADQLRADSLGFSNSKVHTPVLNKLAKEGKIFTNSFCSSPVCTPSRASIFTGRYPMNTGAWNIGTCLNEDEMTMADWLKEEGYFNIAVGKMHLRPQLKNLNWEFEEVAIRDRPRERDNTYFGFDITHITEDDKQGEYLDYATEHGYPMGKGKGKDGINPIPEELHQTYWTGMMSCKEIEKFDFKQPLFMVSSFVDPHHPFDPIKKFVDLYQNMQPENKIDKKYFETGRPEYLKTQGERGYWPGGGEQHPFSQKQINEITKYYYAMISFIDQEVGKILNVLEKKGELENTIIIFTSDHGEYLGDYGLLKKGPFMYDNLIKVPLVFSGKGIKAGKSDEIVENIDILPTVLEMIGKKVPYGIQGVSLKNILTDRNVEKHKKAAIVTYDAHDRGILVKTYRTKEYKLTIFLNENYAELYDLVEDPNETKNVYFEKEYENIKNQLILEICHKLIECSDPLSERYASW